MESFVEKEFLPISLLNNLYISEYYSLFNNITPLKVIYSESVSLDLRIYIIFIIICSHKSMKKNKIA